MVKYQECTDVESAALKNFMMMDGPFMKGGLKLFFFQHRIWNLAKIVLQKNKKNNQNFLLE